MNVRPVVVLAVVVLGSAACNASKLVTAPASTCPAGSAISASSEVPTRHVSPPPMAPITEPATADAVAASAQQLLDAMDVTPTLTVTNVLYGGKPSQAAAFDGLGSLAPFKGSSFAFLSTGVAGATTSKSLDSSVLSIQPGTDMWDPTAPFAEGATNGPCPGSTSGATATSTNDCAYLTFSFVAPSDAHSIAFDFNFMSTEYPEFVGLTFNDSFKVSMKSTTNNYANIVYDSGNNPISINSVLFPQGSCTSLTGTGFQITSASSTDPQHCDAGGTGHVTTHAPITPGETVTLTFEIYDAGDPAYDSAVMIDNFHTDAQPVATPNTGTPTPTPATSPEPTPTPC
jgi:hypothetical protein